MSVVVRANLTKAAIEGRSGGLRVQGVSFIQVRTNVLSMSIG